MLCQGEFSGRGDLGEHRAQGGQVGGLDIGRSHRAAPEGEVAGGAGVGGQPRWRTVGTVSASSTAGKRRGAAPTGSSANVRGGPASAVSGAAGAVPSTDAAGRLPSGIVACVGKGSV